MPPIDESVTFVPVRIAVMTVSDSRDASNDISGDTLAGRIADAGHVLADRVIVKDDIATIRAQLQQWIEDGEIDAIVTTGGTGLTGRDVTVEAMKPLFEKEIDGFAAVFHRISYEKIGTSTLQSRACAGVAGGTYLFALPGSPGAVKDGWDGILKYQLDIRHKPCNFVEIMPRLMER
jgi:molybdenum cofactor biosynthesis protein B